MEARDALAVYDTLIPTGQDHGITPVGILAMDVARVEAGLFMIEVDYSSTNHTWIEAQKSSPFEMGLDWTVNLDKLGYFVGRRPLQQENKRGILVEVEGTRNRMDRDEHLFAESGLPPQDPRNGDPRQSSYSGGKCSGGLCLDL